MYPLPPTCSHRRRGYRYKRKKKGDRVSPWIVSLSTGIGSVLPLLGRQIRMLACVYRCFTASITSGLFICLVLSRCDAVWLCIHWVVQDTKQHPNPCWWYLHDVRSFLFFRLLFIASLCVHSSPPAWHLSFFFYDITLSFYLKLLEVHVATPEHCVQHNPTLTYSCNLMQSPLPKNSVTHSGPCQMWL